MFLQLKIPATIVLLISLLLPFATFGKPITDVERVRSIEEATSGPPDITGKQLNTDAIVAFKAKRLANAHVVWVNYDLLREMGIRVPPDGLTPAFEKELLDAFGYVVPGEGDNPNLYLNQEKTFYATRYGGGGTDAYGDGRAAAAGSLQAKGGGRTPLAPEKKVVINPKDSLWKKFVDRISAYTHSHGGTSLREDIFEAIWGEIRHRELPYGGNRVAFIIQFDASTKWAGGLLGDPRGIMVRENSVRPAHFMQNIRAQGENADAELARIAKLNIEHLWDALPRPANVQNFEALSKKQQLDLMLKELIERVGKVFSSEYARSYFHGSTSPSNIEITGKAIDHGPMTGLDGFTKALAIDDAPSGDITEIRQEIVYSVMDDLRKTLPKEYQSVVPTKAQAGQLLRVAYDKNLAREFLWLAGTPPEFVEEVSRTAAGKNFAKVLKTIAQSGNDEIVNSLYSIPRNTGDYEFDRVANLLGDNAGKSSVELNTILKREVPEARLRQQLAEAYQNYFEELSAVAKKSNVSRRGLLRYFSEATKIRNKKNTDLFRGPGQWRKIYALVLRFTTFKNRRPIEEFIEKNIHETARTFPNAPPYSLVLSTRIHPESGTVFHRIFDATTEQTRVIAEARVIENEVNFLGKVMPLEKAQASQILINGGNFAQVSTLPEVKNRKVFFALPDFPIEDDFELLLKNKTTGAIVYAELPKNMLLVESKQVKSSFLDIGKLAQRFTDNVKGTVKSCQVYFSKLGSVATH